MPVPAAAPTTAPFSPLDMLSMQPPSRTATATTESSFILIMVLSRCCPSWRRHIRLRPVLVRIEGHHRRRALRRFGPEVALVDVAALADDEGHHAGLTIAHRPGDRREAADHAAGHDIAGAAARCRRSLRIEQVE